MSRIDELLFRLCPNGVPYKQMGELGKFYGGLSGKSKNDFVDGNGKFITYMNVYSNPALKLDVEDKVKISDGEKQRTLQYGDILFTGSSETPDECGISSVITEKTDEKLYLNSFCFFFRFDESTIMLPEFAVHLFRSNNLRYQIGKTANGVTRFNVSKKLMEKVIIPIPPMDVQHEIASILDIFTLYITELELEFVQRNNQYEYYRDKLIVPASNVKRTKLKDIATGFYRGSGITRDEIVEDGIPCIRYAEIYTEYNTWFDTAVSHTDIDKISNPKHCSHGDILFAATGETVEDIGKSVAYVGDEDCLVGGDIVVMKHNQNPKYIAYALSTRDAIRQKGKGKVKSKVVHTNPSSLCEIEIFLPPLDVQEQIVNVLDNFNTLCIDSKTGIQAEINARQKQYEFYRDKLLSF